MNRYIKKLITDPSGYIQSNLRELKYQVNQWYYSGFMHIVLALKGVRANKAVFYNKSNFYRCPESTIKIGQNCIFDSSKHHNMIGVNSCCIVATLSKQAQLTIGNASGFSGVKIGCFQSITIGDDCLTGANVLITDSDWHPIDPARRHEFGEDAPIATRPVKIGNNVFIGVNSIILKGTTIGNNSVIGAGSVVSGTIPANVIAAGNPCKVIKSL
ncbi:hypothetical protein AGMMS4957_18180 [Bacteroidia bacterium]|nr:hypothetical protein AGMMS4957_18180 [Bacteroidia bacterium]